MKVLLEGKKYNVKECKGFSKIRGLMFSKKKNLIFKLKGDEIVHNIFVFFPINLYFLDEKFRIIEKAKLNPFWIYIPKVKARYLVEIPL